LNVHQLPSFLFVFAVFAAWQSVQVPSASTLLFEDRFEGDLRHWDARGEDAIFLRDSGERDHGKVLALVPNGDVIALIKGSARFGAVRLEGDVKFIDDYDNYLGFVYNHRRRAERDDFGLIYIKGNDSYLQANPHRDWNVSRLVYPEYRVSLAGPAGIKTGQWQRFAMEVVGREAHVYVGNMTVPQMTFSLFEGDSGAIGLQPRSVGGDVWVDNIQVSSISRLSYTGPPLPRFEIDRQPFLTDWLVTGPYKQTDDRLARQPGSDRKVWRPLAADARGAVVSGTVVDYHGTDTVAYVRTRVTRARAGDAELRISTVDDLALWVNGRFSWFIPRSDAAWFDFLRNPAHGGQRIPLSLEAGDNELTLRVRGGVYASGGFFAAIAEGPPASPFSGPPDAGPYAAGLRTEVVTVQGTPVQILVWYPTRDPRPGVTFGGLVDATCVSEGQPTRSTPLEDCRARWLADLVEYRPSERITDQIFDLRTRSALDAAPMTARFPVVVFDGGLRSDALGYFSLAEYLASHGIVAVSVPSTPPVQQGSLTFNAAGVRHKTSIVRAALDTALRRPDVDPGRVVLAAWSVGGASTSVAAIDDARVRGVLSLDGAVGYDYGLPLVRELASTRRTAAPILHITGKAPNAYPVPKTMANLPEVSDRVWVLELDGVNHSHFIAQGGVVPFAGNTSPAATRFWSAHAVMQRAVRQFIAWSTSASREDDLVLDARPADTFRRLRAGS